MSDRRRIGVLVSGQGSNLAALLERSQDPSFPATIELVISNRADAGALEVARAWKIAFAAMPVSDFGGSRIARDAAMVERLRAANVELVVCAGYNMVLSDDFLNSFNDAVLNVHPSLLPAFAGGMNAVEQALDAGVRVTGCTVQMLEPGMVDGGPIILQSAVQVHPDDDLEALRLRIHEQEWRLLPEAVALWCNDRLVREGRRIRIRNGHHQLTPA